MRWLKWVPVAVAVLAAAAVSSLWAHHVVAEHLAHSDYTSAKASLLSDIRVARAQGLFPSELVSYNHQLSLIERAHPPKDRNFWSTDQGTFYSRQSKALARLAARLHARVKVATATAKTHATWLVRQYADQITLANGSGLGIGTEQKRLANDQLNLAHARTVVEYRALSGAIQPALASFQKAVRQRRSELDGIMSKARASGHPVQWVYTYINSQVAAANQVLTQLHLFEADPGFTRWLNRTSAWALSKKWLKYAAVGAADVDEVVAAIKTRMAKAMPAKWILISTEGEWIRWYEHSTQIGYSLTTTGNPTLPTVLGHFTIFAKFSPFTFVSPFPAGSPDYYPPSPVSYAMEFQNQGYFIHDAPWRSAFGPGTDGSGTPGTNYGGTHGCVNVPFNVAQFLFGWAPIGTPVVVV